MLWVKYSLFEMCIRDRHDLARFVDHLPLLLGDAFVVERPDMRQEVEGDGRSCRRSSRRDGSRPAPCPYRRPYTYRRDEILRIFLSLELSLLLTHTPFNLPTALLCGFFLLVCGFNFSGCVVVCGHEIFGTDVLRVTEVLTEFLDAFSQSPDRFENPYGNGQTPGHQKCGNRSYELP